jgi:hypothetical protein
MANAAPLLTPTISGVAKQFRASVCSIQVTLEQAVQ